MANIGLYIPYVRDHVNKDNGRVTKNWFVPLHVVNATLVPVYLCTCSHVNQGLPWLQNQDIHLDRCPCVGSVGNSRTTTGVCVCVLEYYDNL